MMSKQSGRAGATSVSKLMPETRCITVFINGDEHFSGLRCVISQKQMKYYSALLNYLTEKLQPNFGAVRTLYDIENGKKTASLTDLMHNQKYAAAGVESFKRQDKWFQDCVKALNAGQKKQKSLIRQQSSNASSTSVKKHQNSGDGCLSIYVYKNGKCKTAPAKCILNKSDLLSWNKLVQSVNLQLYQHAVYAKNEKVSNGFRLCCATGQVLKPEDIRNGGTYVAVSNFETFRRRDYLPGHEFQKSLPHKTSSGDSNFDTGTTTTKNCISTEEQRNVVPVGSRNEIFDFEIGDVNGDISVKTIFSMKDSENIFHAKEENFLARGAKEIQDSNDTVTELPLELLEPQEVMEDIIMEPQDFFSGDSKQNDDFKLDFGSTKRGTSFQANSDSLERIIGIEI